jgi:hypothetical protein
MPKRIYLSEIQSYALALGNVAKWPNAREAIDALISQRFAFDPETGMVYCGSQWVSRYSDPSEYSPDYGDIRMIAADHMSGHIANACRRLADGYDA